LSSSGSEAAEQPARCDLGEASRAAALAHRGLSALLKDPGLLGHFARSSFCKNSDKTSSIGECGDDGRHGPSIWPLPPEDVARAPRGGRRRRCAADRVAQTTQLNAMLVVLSFLSLGERRVCPPAGRLGALRTPEQWMIVRRLRGTVASWFCGPSPVDSQFPKLDQLLSIGRLARAAPLGTSLPPSCALATTDFKGAIFKKTAACFDAAKFLSPLSAACLLEPSLLETSRTTDGQVALRPPGLFQHGTSYGVIGFL